MLPLGGGAEHPVVIHAGLDAVPAVSADEGELAHLIEGSGRTEDALSPDPPMILGCVRVAIGEVPS